VTSPPMRAADTLRVAVKPEPAKGARETGHDRSRNPCLSLWTGGHPDFRVAVPSTTPSMMENMDHGLRIRALERELIETRNAAVRLVCGLLPSLSVSEDERRAIVTELYATANDSRTADVEARLARLMARALEEMTAQT